ncbi:lytic murein transglycosylase B [Aquincola sp. MAHUQ-54]|uniref:Lytic murein transglycosylase B n=1 Tax=Aquincola agrisoli TaxID=3119538 RepID=A0AAW9Q8E7_9BURK
MSSRPLRAPWLMLAASLTLTMPLAAHATQPAKKPKTAAAKARSDSAPDIVTYGRRDDVMAFADDTAQRHGLDAAWVREQLAGARYLPSVARLIMPPPAGTAKNWAAYRSRFIEPERIAAGLRFWLTHEAALARAEAQYGVPAQIVVGIIGVETFYGRVTGNFRVLDALATLAFDFPTGRKDRTPFFRGELEELIRWCAGGGCDPQALRGSYAGAIGLPQFMPGSINRHAVDFDGDGRIDLLRSPEDAIGSVAHYLANFGWQRGMPTHYDVAPPSETTPRAMLLAPDIVPSFTAAQMLEQGAVLGEDAQRHPGPLALVELQNGDAAPSYVAGTANFYAVTRYNWSSYYALAVIDLGSAIAAAHRAATR